MSSSYQELMSLTRSTANNETKINYGVLALYIIIVGFLGSALLYSLYRGAASDTFSSSLITALTTIAGFGVGANSGKKD